MNWTHFSLRRVYLRLQFYFNRWTAPLVPYQHEIIHVPFNYSILSSHIGLMMTLTKSKENTPKYCPRACMCTVLWIKCLCSKKSFNIRAQTDGFKTNDPHAFSGQLWTKIPTDAPFVLYDVLGDGRVPVAGTFPQNGDRSAEHVQRFRPGGLIGPVLEKNTNMMATNLGDGS